MGDRTNAERQRRYIARLKARAVEGVTSAPDTAEVAALAQKLAQAEQQLAAAKARILNLEDEIAALRGALAHERKRHAAKPKAEKPAPTPDEARDRQIKALKNAYTRRLRGECQHAGCRM
jgi:predicted  nucleic acid-binding Zn-ribbon protein